MKLNREVLYQMFFADNPSAIQEVTNDYFKTNGFKMRVNIRNLLDNRLSWWLRQEVYAGRMVYVESEDAYYSVQSKLLEMQ